MRSFVSLIAVAFVAGLAGCQSSSGRTGSDSIPVLSADAVNAAGLSAQEASDAHALCVAKCVKCHKFYDPAGYSQKDWDLWMRKMGRKSKLKPAQEQLLARYLGEFRKRQK